MVRQKESYPVGLSICPSGSTHCFHGKGGVRAQSVVRNCARFERIMVLGRVCRKVRAKVAGSTNPLCGSIKATFSTPDLSFLYLSVVEQNLLLVELYLLFQVCDQL